MREKYQRPILRKYWKLANKDENNPNAAFRIRENPKMKTRRNNRTNDHENLEKVELTDIVINPNRWKPSDKS